MEFIRGLQGLRDRHRGAAITIGSFDGIHLGHGALIASTCGIAKQLARPAMMLTFEPLPREYLVPQDPPARLTDFRERMRLLERSDLPCACVLRFDSKLRSLSGEVYRIVNETTGEPVENPVTGLLRDGKLDERAKDTVLLSRTFDKTSSTIASTFADS